MSAMRRSGIDIMWEARKALGLGSQRELAAALGYSRRTGQRWSSHGGPDDHVVRDMVKLVFRVDAVLAGQIAASRGITLESMGLVQAYPAAPPPSPPPRVPLPARAVDAVVCAAAEAMRTMPQEARPALLAAFTCAQELGLTLDEVTHALRTSAERAT